MNLGMWGWFRGLLSHLFLTVLRAGPRQSPASGTAVVGTLAAGETGQARESQFYRTDHVENGAGTPTPNERAVGSTPRQGQGGGTGRGVPRDLEGLSGQRLQ